MKVISKQQAYYETIQNDYLFCNNCLKILFFVDIKIKVNNTNIIIRCKNCNKIIKFIKRKKNDNCCNWQLRNREDASVSIKSL